MKTKKLIKNKLVSLTLILSGLLSIGVEGDGTFFIFALLIGIPLFFEKEDCIIG